MVAKKNLPIYLLLFLINLYFCKNVIEIPLKPMKVKNVPKYQNITLIKAGKRFRANNSSIYYEEGNTNINTDLLFLADVKVGSNNNKFSLLLDTGSNIFWIAEKGCDGSHKIKNFFDPSSSTTCKPTGEYFEIKYGSGSCEGYYYYDDIQYLSDKKFNMKFGVTYTANFKVEKGDGIIGLTKSYDDESFSFIHMMKKSGNTNSSAFSIKFENDKFTSGIKGSMFIGEHDDFSKDEVSTCPLVFFSNKIFWACQLRSFGLKSSNHQTKSSYSTNIIFDTGTNAIFLPTRYLSDMIDELGDFGCYAQKQDSTYIICQATDSVPDLRFELNGYTLIIPKEYGFYYIGDNTKYVASIVTFEDSIIPIIGSIFFFLFHTLFDEENNELKFYPLKDGLIEGGLSTFVIILIVIASLATVALIIYVIVYCIKKRKANDNMLTENINGGNYENLFHNIN